MKFYMSRNVSKIKLEIYQTNFFVKCQCNISSETNENVKRKIHL